MAIVVKTTPFHQEHPVSIRHVADIHMKSNVLFAATATALLIFFSATAKCAATTPKNTFIVFNALHYNNTPELSLEGLHNVKLIYEDKLTSSPTYALGERLFSAPKIKAMAASSRSTPATVVSLDLESWGAGPKAIDKYVKSVQLFKKESPESKVGMYGFVQFANNLVYQSIDTHNPKLMARWKDLQRQVRPVADNVDVFMPSLYTWGKDANAWKKTAKITIEQARSINPNKPIYVYIWPQYYNNKEPYALHFIDQKTWRDELETLYQLADGIVIWSSNKDSEGKLIQFSKNMPWYTETINFMKSHDIH